MRAFPLVAFLLAAATLPAAAQDALRGKRLYYDVGRVRGTEVSCVDCHGAFPGALHGIGKASGNPDAIAYAVGAILQMAPLRERVTGQDMADLVAYLAFPGVPSPEPRLSAAGPASSPYGADRLEFPESRAGSPPMPPTALRLTNIGAKPLSLLSAPVLDGPAAAQFGIAATDCAAGAVLAPQQSCTVDIVFASQGEPGLRAARVGLSHDWIRGGLYVALLGRVVPP